MIKRKNKSAIQTERLTLIPLKTRHAKQMLKLWGDPDVVRYMNLQAYRKLRECRSRIKRLLLANVEGGCPNHFVLLIEREVIGLIGFPLNKEEGPQFGLYYLLLKKCWGSGYATEAADAVLKYLFEQYPNAVVLADSVADNLASVAVLGKLGFNLIKREVGVFTKNGDSLDVLHFMRQ